MDRGEQSQPGPFTVVNDHGAVGGQAELTTDERLRRGHQDFLRLNEEIRMAKEREVAARTNLAAAQREADDGAGRALPLVERAVAAVLEEADKEAASVLAAAGARALEIAAEAQRVFRQVVSQVQEALDEAWRADQVAPAPAVEGQPLDADAAWFAALWEGSAADDPFEAPPPA